MDKWPRLLCVPQPKFTYKINHDTPHGTVYFFFMVLQQLYFLSYVCDYLSKNCLSN